MATAQQIAVQYVITSVVFNELDGWPFHGETRMVAVDQPSRNRRTLLRDFELRADGLYVRRTGQKLDSAVLTLGEVWKWLGYYLFVRSRGAMRRISDRKKTYVWFAPEHPRPWYVIWAACTWAGFGFARSEAEADLCFYFEDVTVGAPIHTTRHYANSLCWDISKSRVARVFAEVAGYPLSIDPTTYSGAAVEKGERNGAHDGRIVNCPTARVPFKCYEKLIDATRGDVAIDLRVSIVGRRPVGVLQKSKPVGRRFSIHNDDVRWIEINDAFEPMEIILIQRFCQEMQLDVGALDVLRDQSDGRIYIVDVNKTDTGPAVDLTWADRIKITAALSHALRLGESEINYKVGVSGEAA